MKKILFGIVLFFICMTPSFAKEFEIGGKKYNIDTDTYPYFIVDTRYSNPTLLSKTVITTDSSSDAYGNWTFYYEGTFKKFKINNSTFYTNNDIKDNDGNIIFKKNISTGLGRFPININSVSLSYIENSTTETDKLYSRVLNHIKEHPNECKYYYISGIEKLYFDGYGNQEVIQLKCYDQDSKFNLCPSRESNNDYININNTVNKSDTYFFGYNGFEYHSIDEYSNVFYFKEPKENLKIGDGFNFKNSYFLTNISNYTFDCSNNVQSSNIEFYDSIIFQGKEYEVGSSIYFKQPTVDYDLEENNLGGYNILLTYKNMTEEYYTNYYNLTLGETVNINLNNGNTYKIENLNLDTIITVYIYDLDNNMIDSKVIDLNNIQIDLKNDPYILIKGYNQEKVPNSVSYRYYNTNNKMKCYHQFGGQEKIEEDCSNSKIYLRYAQYNTYLHLYIEKDDKVIYKKSLNLNFIDGMPQIKFNSYYDSLENNQKLNIKLNFVDTNTDTFYFSYDNLTWNQFYEVDSTLIFYNNTDFYVKIKRNNEDIADGYIYVVFNSYANGNPTGTGVTTNMKNILDYFDSFIKINDNLKIMFNNTWNSAKNSKIIIYFMTLITGTVIILIIKAFNR